MYFQIRRDIPTDLQILLLIRLLFWSYRARCPIIADSGMDPNTCLRLALWDYRILAVPDAVCIEIKEKRLCKKRNTVRR